MSSGHVAYILPSSVLDIPLKQKVIEFCHLSDIQEVLFALRTLGILTRPFSFLLEKDKEYL